jgi:hypothetical protein
VRRIVRTYAHRFATFEMTEAPENQGLMRSLRSGIDQVLEGADRIVVLEDDLVTEPGFLEYIQGALDHYQDHPQVGSVTGYQYPLADELRDSSSQTLFFPRFNCWGWGTWKDRWKAIDWQLPTHEELLKDRALFARLWAASNDLPEILLERIDGQNQSWAIQVALDHVVRGAYAVYPPWSLVKNIGMDGTGTHFRSDNGPWDPSSAQKFQTTLHSGASTIEFSEDADPGRIARYLALVANSPGRRLKNWLRYGRFF